MICLDVNVLVTAHRADLPDHDVYRELLAGLANGSEPVGVPDVVLSGFLRLVTNRRIFVIPTAPDDAWSDVDRLLSARATTLLHPGAGHWPAFRALATEFGARGNDLPDAYIGAYALENRALLLSSDRGFARFGSLRWRHPLD